MPQIKVLVINLKRSTARRKYVKKLLDEAGIKFEFFEACDGNKLSDRRLEEAKKLNEQEGYSEKMHPLLDNMGKLDHNISKNTLGCTISHLDIYQKIIDEKLDWCCILEDDFIIRNLEGFKYLLEKANLEKLKNKIDFIFLFYNLRYTNDYKKVFNSFFRYLFLFFKINFLFQSIGKNIFLSNFFSDYITGTVAYILNNNAAKKLLQEGKPARQHADILTGRGKSLKIKQRITIPGIIDHRYEIVSEIVGIPYHLTSHPIDLSKHKSTYFYWHSNKPLRGTQRKIENVKRKIYQKIFFILSRVLFKLKKREILNLMNFGYYLVLAFFTFLKSPIKSFKSLKELLI